MKQNFNRQKNNQINGQSVFKIYEQQSILAIQNRQQSQNYVRYKQKRQCRICLEGENQGRIVKPCNCIGSISFVHENCLSEWIKRKQQKNIKIKVCCEMCHSPFNYQICKSRSFSYQQFCLNYERNRGSFRLFFVGIIFFIIIIVGLIMILINSTENNSFGKIVQTSVINSQNIKVVYICAVFLLTLVLIFMITFFLIQNAVKGQYLITNIKNYNQPRQVNDKKVYPLIK